MMGVSVVGKTGTDRLNLTMRLQVWVLPARLKTYPHTTLYAGQRRGVRDLRKAARSSEIRLAHFFDGPWALM